eukprot:TRINITY_DN9344_c0_g1_i1.p1 TRINITY_DN9344_c0_g1~~TRINITY_DN9344_c0_g1_i1.p1  ORF type:complete len:1750 (-),score=489.94 TRINITY_DN9344_c0_g1_i1:43-5292(-)
MLENAIIHPKMNVGREIVTLHLNPIEASSARDALAKELYGRLFLWVVDRINQTLKVVEEDDFIGLLDIAGFEIFEYNTFEQLCINFTNEKLQQFFNRHMFTLEQEEYEREGISFERIDFGADAQATIDLIDSKRGTGIFKLLDEVTMYKGTDVQFTNKLYKAASKRNPKFVGSMFESDINFSIKHYAGEVEYTTENWVYKNGNPIPQSISETICSSEDELIVDMFDRFDTSQDTNKKLKTVSSKYKSQLDDLMDTLSQTSPHFIRCIIPNHEKKPLEIDDEIVLGQLRCNGVLEGIKISRAGYPNRLYFEEFAKRYYILVKDKVSKDSTDYKGTTKTILDNLVRRDVINSKGYQFGKTKIFFRVSQLGFIEEAREQVVGEIIITLQALARGFVGRKLHHQKIQAIESSSYIQETVRWIGRMQHDPWLKLFIQMKHLSGFKGQKRAQKLTKDLKDVKKEILTEDNEVKSLKTDYNKVGPELDSLIPNFEELQANNIILRQNYETTTSKLTLATEKMNSYKEEEDEKTRKSRNLINGINSAEDSIMRMEKKLKEKSSSFDSESKKLQQLLSQKHDLDVSIEEIKAEKIELQAREVDLQTKIFSLKQSVTELSEENKDLLKNNKNFRKEVESISIEIEKVIALNKSVEKKNKNYKRKVNQFSNEGKVLMELNNKNKRVHAKLEDEINSINYELEKVAEANDEASENHKYLVQNLKKIMKVIGDQTGLKKKQIENNERTSRSLEKLKQKLNSKQTTLNSLIDQKYKSDEEYQNLAIEIERTNQQINVLQQTKANLLGEIDDNEEKLSESTTRITKQKSKEKKLKSQIKQITQEIDLANSSISRIKKSLESDRKTKNIFATQLSKERADVAKLNGEREIYESQLELLNEQKVLAENELHELVLERKSAQYKKEELSEILDELEESYSSLKKQINALKVNIRNINDKRDTLSKDTDDINVAIELMKTKIDDINRELEQEREENNESHDLITNLESDLSSNTKELKYKSNDINDLQEKMHDIKSSVDKIIQSIDQSNKDISQLKIEEASFQAKIRDEERKQEHLEETLDRKSDNISELDVQYKEHQMTKILLNEELKDLTNAKKQKENDVSKALELIREKKEINRRIELQVNEKKDHLQLLKMDLVEVTELERIEGFSEKVQEVIFVVKQELNEELERREDAELENKKLTQDIFEFQKLVKEEKVNIENQQNGILSAREELVSKRNLVDKAIADNENLKNEVEREEELLNQVTQKKEALEMMEDNSLEIAKLKRNLETKQKELRSIQHQVETFQISYDHLERQREKLSSQLEGETLAMTGLEQYHNELDRDMQSAKLDQSVEGENFRLLEDQIKSQMTEINELQQRYLLKGEEKHSLQIEINERKTDLEATIREIELENSLIKELNHQYKMSKKRIENLKESGKFVSDEEELALVRMKRDIKRTIKANTKSRSHMQKLEMEKEDQNRIAWRLMKSVDKLTTEYDMLRQDRLAAQKNVNILQADIEGATNEIEFFSMRRDKADSLKHDLKYEIEHLRDQLKSQEERASALNDYKFQNDGILEELEENEAKEIAAYDEILDDIRKLQLQTKEQRENLYVEQMVNERYILDKEAFEREYKAYFERCETIRLTIIGNESKLDKLEHETSTFAQRQSDLEKKLSRNQADIQRIDTQITLVKSDTEKYKDTVLQLTDERDKYELELKVVRSAIRGVEREIKKEQSAQDHYTNRKNVLDGIIDELERGRFYKADSEDDSSMSW